MPQKNCLAKVDKNCPSWLCELCCIILHANFVRETEQMIVLPVQCSCLQSTACEEELPMKSISEAMHSTYTYPFKLPLSLSLSSSLFNLSYHTP